MPRLFSTINKQTNQQKLDGLIRKLAKQAVPFEGMDTLLRKLVTNIHRADVRFIKQCLLTRVLDHEQTIKASAQIQKPTLKGPFSGDPTLRAWKAQHLKPCESIRSALEGKGEHAVQSLQDIVNLIKMASRAEHDGVSLRNKLTEALLDVALAPSTEIGLTLTHDDGSALAGEPCCHFEDFLYLMGLALTLRDDYQHDYSQQLSLK